LVLCYHAFVSLLSVARPIGDGTGAGWQFCSTCLGETHVALQLLEPSFVPAVARRFCWDPWSQEGKTRSVAAPKGHPPISRFSRSGRSTAAVSPRLALGNPFLVNWKTPVQALSSPFVKALCLHSDHPLFILPGHCSTIGRSTQVRPGQTKCSTRSSRPAARTTGTPREPSSSCMVAPSNVRRSSESNMLPGRKTTSPRSFP